MTRPDKGRGVVILDKSVYLERMEELISDPGKFLEISEPIFKFTLRIEDKINNYLRKLKKLCLITEDLYKQLFVSGGGPGVLYGLPKIHKPDFVSNFKFRPIFSAINCPSFNLSKFFVKILEPLTRSEYTLENSKSFVEVITKFGNADSYTMASFDVENLFTNIPLTETINICLNSLFPLSSSSVLGLKREFFQKLLELATCNSYFKFNSKFNHQIDGVGMGIPLGPTLANTFMCFYEKIWLRDCPDDFRPILYRRFIDDTFLLFRDSAHVNKFYHYLNQKHPNIKFTKEIESNKSLSFLDVEIVKSNNAFATNVYRKPSFTGQGFSFHSFCPFNVKIAVLKTYLHRAYDICSTYVSLDREFSFFRSYLMNNGYLSRTIYHLNPYHPNILYIVGVHFLYIIQYLLQFIVI